jgi:hypothetical protein
VFAKSVPPRRRRRRPTRRSKLLSSFAFVSFYFAIACPYPDFIKTMAHRSCCYLQQPMSYAQYDPSSSRPCSEINVRCYSIQHSRKHYL